MRALLALPLGLFVLLAASPARAVIDEYAEGKKKKETTATAAAAKTEKVAWRNSTITYENVVSALSFSEGADLSYNPYYAQSISFRPRYYLRDDLSLRGRLDLEIELTTSDETNHAREWVVSDLFFDVSYTPTWMKIPVLDVMVNPSLRLAFPTSIASRGRSMMMTLGPGVAMRREIPLLKGRFLKSVGVAYAFRATKYLHEYTTAQLDSAGICSSLLTDPDKPACQTSGKRNVSWRLSNTFEVRLTIMDKLTFTADVMLFNDMIYGLDGETVGLNDGTEVPLEESRVNHRGSTWAIFDLSYDLLDWLWLSLGVSTYYPHLAPNSSYYSPFLNRYTAFYLDVTVPVDRFVDQVRGWARR